MATNTAIGNKESRGEGNFFSFIVSSKIFGAQISSYFLKCKSLGLLFGAFLSFNKISSLLMQFLF